MKFLLEDEQISFDDYELTLKAQDLYNKIKNKRDIEDWFKILVPSKDKADTVAGEIIRAIMRIMYRDYNDGDVFYSGYGVETAGPAAAYLMDKLPENLSNQLITIAENELKDDEYTDALETLETRIIDYLNNHQELIATKNNEDMFEYELDDKFISKFDLDVEIPNNLLKHMDEGHVYDLADEVESWIDGGQKVDDIYVSGDTLYLEGLDEQTYNELSQHLYDWLIDFGNDLDNEYKDDSDDEDEW